MSISTIGVEHFTNGTEVHTVRVTEEHGAEHMTFEVHHPACEGEKDGPLAILFHYGEAVAAASSHVCGEA